MQTKLTRMIGVSGSLLKAGVGLLLLLLHSNFLHAAPSVTLLWDPNSEPDLAGYNVYYGVASTVYTNKVTLGKVTTNLVSGLVSGVKYYFAVTAFNTNAAESDFSNEISYTPPPTTLDIWKSTNFLASDLADPSKQATVWGDNADPDNDGRDNLMEFALGLNPTKSEPTTNAVTVGFVDVASSRYATISFHRKKIEPLLQYVPEVSADGVVWNSGAAYLTQVSTTSLDTTFDLVVFQDLAPVNPANPRFIRLRVIKNDL